jgi:UDP-N-acetylglucosamine 1-carboxyvinyltransferase
MPDRIEAGTILCSVAGAGGEAELQHAPVAELAPVIERLQAAGVKVDVLDDSRIRVSSNGRIKAINIDTQPHPGFPTDMQAQFMAILATAEGTSIINENIFENRFMHVAELKRMGADITVKDSTAIVKGVQTLSGAPVMASDLRASAGLVIAALMATNTSEIQRIYHLDRGYESFEEKLSALGADVVRV